MEGIVPAMEVPGESQTSQRKMILCDKPARALANGIGFPEEVAYSSILKGLAASQVKRGYEASGPVKKAALAKVLVHCGKC